MRWPLAGKVLAIWVALVSLGAGADPIGTQSVKVCDPLNHNLCANVVLYPDGGAALNVTGAGGGTTTTGGGGGTVAQGDAGTQAWLVQFPDGGAQVTILNWPIVQPVSIVDGGPITVTVTNFPASNSGTVVQGDGGPPWLFQGMGTPGTPAGGVVSVQGVDGGTPAPISAAALPLPANAAQETGGNLAGLATHQTDGTQKTQVTNFPATQPISAVALPLPSLAATSTLQSNGQQTGQIVGYPFNGSQSAAAVSDGGQLNVTGPDGGPLPVIVNSMPAITGSVSVSNFPAVQAVSINDAGFYVLNLPVDSSPATQNITAQDVASSSTPQANGQNAITGTPTAGSSAPFAISTDTSVRVQVTGTWTGTLINEGSFDNGTTWVSNAVHEPGTSFTTVSFTSNYIGVSSVAGMTNFRVRATAAWTGTALVRITQSANLASIYVVNPIRLQDPTNQSISANVIAGSVGADAGNQALVVAPSPNTVGKVTNAAEHSGANGNVLCTPYSDGGAVLIPFTAGQQHFMVQDMSLFPVNIGFSSAVGTDAGHGLVNGWALSQSPDGVNPGGLYSTDTNEVPALYCAADGGVLNWIENQ